MSEQVCQALLEMVNNVENKPDFSRLVIDKVFREEVGDKDLIDYYFSLLLLKTANYFEAKEQLTKLANKNPEIREYNVALSLLYAKVGNFEEALFYLKLSHAAKPHPLAKYMTPNWFVDPAVEIQQITNNPLLNEGLTAFHYGRSSTGIKLLIEQSLLYPDNLNNWQALADNYLLLDRQLESYKARSPLINTDNATLDNFQKSIYSLILLGLWEKVYEFSDLAITHGGDSNYILYANKLAKLKLGMITSSADLPKSKSLKDAKTKESSQTPEVAIFCGILSDSNPYLNWLNFLVYNQLINVNFHLFYQANSLDNIANTILKLPTTSNNIANIDDETLAEIVKNHNFDLILSFGYEQSGFYPSLLKNQNVYGFNLSKLEVKELGFSGSLNLIDNSNQALSNEIVEVSRNFFLTTQSFINKDTIEVRELKEEIKIISISLPTLVDDYQKFKNRLEHFLTNLDPAIKVFINPKYYGGTETVDFSLDTISLNEKLRKRLSVIEEKQTNESVILPLAYVDLSSNANYSEYQICNMMAIPVFALSSNQSQIGIIEHLVKSERQEQFLFKTTELLTDELNKYLNLDFQERIKKRFDICDILGSLATAEPVATKVSNFAKLITNLSNKKV